MDTITTIKTRRAIRDFTSAEISEADLTTILECGIAAPSPMNSQPWKFIVIKDKEVLRQLSLFANYTSFLMHAKVLIVVLFEPGGTHEEWLEKEDQPELACACAIENMWLAAWSLGIGGCWISLDTPGARKMLGISEKFKIVGSLALGYATESELNKEKKVRKTLQEVVHTERFDM